MQSRLKIETGNDQNRKNQVREVTVGTIHSHVMGILKSDSEESDLVRPELIRLVLYRAFKTLGTFSYGDAYLLDTLIPAAENAMRYVKSYGILPDHIDETRVADLLLKEHKVSSRATPDQMIRLLHDFIIAYSKYEEFKLQRPGRMDYNDILIQGASMSEEKIPYLFVDELQDLSNLQIRVIENMGETLICVGDRKQSIFGFQGGSLSSFKGYVEDQRFRKIHLSEHRRCTPEILGYSAEYLISYSGDSSLHEEVRELKNLRSNGEKVRVFLTNSPIDLVASKVKYLQDSGYQGKIGIIARRNRDVFRISKTLEKMGIKHSSSEPVSLTSTPSSEIITYLKGITYRDNSSISAAILTPFFGLTLEKAAELNRKIHDGNFSLDDLPESYTRKLMENEYAINTLISAFDSIIIPISVSLGRDYLATARKLKDLTEEYIQNMDSISFQEYFTFLDLSPIDSDYVPPDDAINVLTVHKAKGKEFDMVFYLPREDRSNSSYFDRVAAAIIKSTLGVNIEEDLSEESIRIDYVAMTRAKDSLAIITDSNSLVQRYHLDGLTEFFEEDVDPFQTEFTGTKVQDAYSLFINRRESEAIKLRDSASSGWIRDAVSEYFKRIDRVSFSLLSDISSPLQFLKNKVLNISPAHVAAKIGTDFHSLAARYREGNFPDEVAEEVYPMLENYRLILEQIKGSGYRKYPSRTEFRVSSPLEDMDERYRGMKIEIHGFIDALFEADSGPGVLLVDYKTSRTEKDTAKYFLQLTLYSMLYARTYGCRREDITLGLAYVNLSQGINHGEGRPEAKLIIRPAIKGRKESLFELIDRLMRYSSDTELFISDLMADLQEEMGKGPGISNIDKRIMADLSSS